MQLLDRELVVLDLETTDLALAGSPGPEIVEVGAVKVNSSLEIVDTYQTLVQPIALDQFTEFSMRLTGIKPEELEAAPKWTEVWKEFAKFTRFKGARLASWGTTFDISVLKQAYVRNSLGYPHLWNPLDIVTLSYNFAMREGIKFKNWKLRSVCDRFGIEHDKAHRALPDAQAALAVLRKIMFSEDTEPEIEVVGV